MIVIGATTGSGLYQRYVGIEKLATEDIKQNVAQLSRFAERLLVRDPQLLDEEVTQTRSNSQVSYVAVVNSDDKVLFATRFEWRNKLAAEALPLYNAELVKAMKRKRTADIQHIKSTNELIAMMSFIEPSSEKVIRSHKRGFVILAYDLTASENEIVNIVLLEHVADIIFILIAAFVMLWLANIYINKPLSALQIATQSITVGDFSKPLPTNGLEEISTVTNAFNQMSVQLNNYVRELEAQNKHTNTILDNVVDAIITCDTQGDIRSFNLAAEKIFGYSSDAMIGRNLNVLIPVSYGSNHDSYIQKYLDGGQAKVVGKIREVEGLRRGGNVFSIELAVNEIEIEGVKTFIGIVRDITEKKRLDKLKNEFISTVSHELRTPLTALNGAVSLVASGKLSSLPGQEELLLNTAIRNGERLLNLINDLLDMEKIEAGKASFNMDIHNIQTIVDDAITVNNPYADQYNVRVIKQGNLSAINLEVDCKRLEQVVANYLSNACKFSGENSEIEVRIEKDNTKLRVSVIDQGEGIAESFKSHVFQKFSQSDSSTNRKTGGTGLGLSISKGLVENMGGVVGFYSVEGKGATFYFEFPIYKS